jgi:hypothetical protein
VTGVAGRATIIHHPDVRRMLMTMKAQIEAMRSAAYSTAAGLDFAHRAADPAVRARHQARVDLLTPVVKGWCSEVGQTLTSIGLQVHGGMGYVEETGAAQYIRDARITTIYEGTTGIQAGDFVGLKILRDGGAALRDLIADILVTEKELAGHGATHGRILTALTAGREALVSAARWLAANFASQPGVAGAVSYHLLMLTGIVLGGWQLAKSAMVAEVRLQEADADAVFFQTKIVTARFYADQIMPVALAHQRAIENGCDDLLALREDQF